MPRQPDPIKFTIIKRMLEILKGGGNPDSLRGGFHGVSQPSWYRYRQEAIETFEKQGGDFSKKKTVVTKPKSKPGKARAALKKKAELSKRIEAAEAAKPHAVEGEYQPNPERAQTPVGVGPPQIAGLGVVQGDSYIVGGMFPRETTIVSRWSEPPDLHDPLPIIDTLKGVYYSADAVLRSAIKRAGDGHAILDPGSVLNAIEIQRKAVSDILKALEKSRNLESLEKFCEAIMATVRRMAPEHAKVMLAALREAALPFSSRQWQATQPQPTV